MATLKEIAHDVGVSHVLVSRVLNNRMGTTRVSEKTRQAILDRAKELDYVPNPLAVSLQKGRKGVIGIFIHKVGTEGSEMGMRFLQAAGKSLSNNRFNLMLEFFERKEEFLQACNNSLVNKLDGLIVAGIAHQELMTDLAELQKSGLPVASACHRQDSYTSSPISNFEVNYEEQTFLTTKHLLEIGCKRIAHFHYNDERHAGYLRAHKELSLAPDDRLCIPAEGFGSDDGYFAMEKLMKQRATYDGIVTQADSQAAGALQKLALAGVPQDKWPRITGIDNSPIAKYFSLIPLTSVTTESKICAELAVEAIIKQLNGEKTTGQKMSPQLVIRESTMR